MKYVTSLFKSHSAKPRAAPVVRARKAPLKVILFIGHHKVGSTSLQDYLSRNAAALAHTGVLYPYVDFEGMAYMAATAAGHPFPQAEDLPVNVRVPHNALAFRMWAESGKGAVPPWHKKLPALNQMEDAIRQQLRFFNPHTVILAAEVFANFAADSPKSIQRLAALFPGADFTIIATLRRIDEYLASWQGQRLKFGHRLAALRNDGIDTYLNGIHFNYRLMIEGWITQFPKARIILRTYGDVRANGGSVVDFLAQTDIALPGGMMPEQRQNTSFHRGIYEIIRQGNAALAPQKAQALRLMLHKKTSGLDLPPSGKIELFGAMNREDLMQKFRPIDSYLSQVVGRSGFFGDLERALEPLQTPEIEAYRAALESIRKRPAICDDPDIQNFLRTLG